MNRGVTTYQGGRADRVGQMVDKQPLLVHDSVDPFEVAELILLGLGRIGSA